MESDEFSRSVPWGSFLSDRCFEVMSSCLSCSKVFVAVNRNLDKHNINTKIRRTDFTPREVLLSTGCSLPNGEVHLCGDCTGLVRELEKGLRQAEESHRSLSSSGNFNLCTPTKRKSTKAAKRPLPQTPSKSPACKAPRRICFSPQKARVSVYILYNHPYKKTNIIS